MQPDTGNGNAVVTLLDEDPAPAETPQVGQSGTNKEEAGSADENGLEANAPASSAKPAGEAGGADENGLETNAPASDAQSAAEAATLADAGASADNNYTYTFIGIPEKDSKNLTAEDGENYFGYDICFTLADGSVKKFSVTSTDELNELVKFTDCIKYKEDYRILNTHGKDVSTAILKVLYYGFPNNAKLPGENVSLQEKVSALWADKPDETLYGDGNFYDDEAREATYYAIQHILGQGRFVDTKHTEQYQTYLLSLAGFGDEEVIEAARDKEWKNYKLDKIVDLQETELPKGVKADLFVFTNGEKSKYDGSVKSVIAAKFTESSDNNGGGTTGGGTTDGGTTGGGNGGGTTGGGNGGGTTDGGNGGGTTDGGNGAQKDKGGSNTGGETIRGPKTGTPLSIPTMLGVIAVSVAGLVGVKFTDKQKKH